MSENNIEPQKATKNYKLVSAVGTYMATLGRGKIYSTIEMDEEKLTIQTKPAKKSTIPVLYLEDITDVMVNTKITGYALFFVILSAIACIANPGFVIFIALFIWLGLNRKITISLRSGNQAVLYSGSKKQTEAFVADVKSRAKLS